MTLGVWIQFGAKSFSAGDLSFETTILLGVLGGRFTGMVGGAMLALPALLHGEWATLPFNLLCGFTVGQLRNLAPDREDIWSFSPFIDLSIYRWIRRNLPTPRLFDWQIMFFATIVALRFLQSELTRFVPSATYSLESPKWWVEVLIYATSITVIGIELKIWNSVRIQIKLEEQERLLLQARMEALQNQINPHFLFNTLNSVSSLVRFVPSATYSLESPKWWVEVLIYATSITVIGIELKIWNSVRIQIKLEEQERLLLQARMEALQNQINPHFLFNTLNSVSSLVRFD